MALVNCWHLSIDWMIAVLLSSVHVAPSVCSGPSSDTLSWPKSCFLAAHFAVAVASGSLASEPASCLQSALLQSVRLDFLAVG